MAGQPSRRRLVGDECADLVPDPSPATATAGPVPIAGLLVIVAVGQLLGYGLQTSSSPWRLVPAMFLAGLATGMLNALLGREAVASVPPDRIAMGSGANNTARYLGAAAGITLFVVVATHSGANLAAGWNAAVVVSAGITLLGAAAVALAGRSNAQSASAPVCATNKA